MSQTMQGLAELSSAEEFLDFFSIAFDPAVVRVNRLHILKRFSQYVRMSAMSTCAPVAEEDFAVLRGLMLRAYDDFCRSTPAREKVFKVFQDADGARVALDAVRGALPSQRAP